MTSMLCISSSSALSSSSIPSQGDTPLGSSFLLYDPYREPTPFPTVETKGVTGCNCSPFTVSPLPATILFKQKRSSC